MTERHAPRLPAAAEALLSDWPAPERSDKDWEQATEAVLQRVQRGDSSALDDDLLAPPLPQTDADGQLPDRRSSPTGPSLAELARSKVKPDDRQRQLAVAKDSLKHVAEARHTGQTAEHVARTAEVAELQRYRDQQSSGVPDDRGAGWRGGVIGAAVALAAAAAVFVFYVADRGGDALAPPATPAPVAELPSPPAQLGAQEESSEPTARLDELPVETEEEQPVAKTAAGPPPRAGRPRIAKAGGAAAPPAAPPAPAEPDEFDTKLPSADDTDTRKRLAPTTGEALAAVAPSTARAKVCVAGHAPPSTAIVTFGSGGAVESVTVSGPAAGTPAAECIRNAFLAARVAPFAKPRFTVNLPVRP